MRSPLLHLDVAAPCRRGDAVDGESRNCPLPSTSGQRVGAGRRQGRELALRLLRRRLLVVCEAAQEAGSGKLSRSILPASASRSFARRDDTEAQPGVRDAVTILAVVILQAEKRRPTLGLSVRRIGDAPRTSRSSGEAAVALRATSVFRHQRPPPGNPSGNRRMARARPVDALEVIHVDQMHLVGRIARL